jgi:hypothetical protein
MKRHFISTLAFAAVVIFFASPPAVHGQHNNGWGGGGGGWGGGRGDVGHGSFAPSHSGSPASRGTMPGGHPYSAHAVHPIGPMAYHHGYYGHWYHGDWHDHYNWIHPWHYGPVAWFSFGFVAGAVVWDTPWRWGYWPYYNPYYCPTVVVVGEPPIDYSQPIVVARAPNIAPALADQRAAQYLDAAHDAFVRGDYAAAMAQVNGAIAVKPNDTVPHEFRALVLFATRRYKEAAGAAYAVLSVGPGWDWATLAGMYPDINVYTAQIRALEQYRNDNPTAPEAHFLLAYHYMTCGHLDAAIGELRDVVRLNSRDQLSAQLLAALTRQQNPGDAKPSLTGTPTTAPTAPAVPAAPVTAAALAGSWTATRSDGASFSLELGKDGTYTWRHTLQGQSQTYSGAYTVADNLLILKEGGNPAMIGQVAQLDANRFNFKMVGNNPADPGLAFTKR